MSQVTRLVPRSSSLAPARPPPAAVAVALRAAVVCALLALWAKLAFGGFLGGISALEGRFGSHALAVGMMLIALLALFLKSLRVGLWLFYRRYCLANSFPA